MFYLLDPVDDFIMTSLGEYEEKKLVSADSADIELPIEEKKGEEKEPLISSKEVENLITWIKETLGDRVKEVRESKRFIDRPVLIVNPDAGITTSMRRIMKAAGKDLMDAGQVVLEINTQHPLIIKLKNLRDGKTDKGFLQTCVVQMYYNALTEVGLMEDPKPMVESIYEIMEHAIISEELKNKGKK